jgi:hypothetical protein
VNSLNIGGRSEISKAASGSGGFILAAFIFCLLRIAPRFNAGSND